MKLGFFFKGKTDKGFPFLLLFPLLLSRSILENEQFFCKTTDLLEDAHIRGI